VADKPGDALENAINENVLLNVEKLKSAAPILSKAVEDKKVRVVGATYDFATGRVALLA
jgi:carbonic anhydrase